MVSGTDQNTHDALLSVLIQPETETPRGLIDSDGSFYHISSLLHSDGTSSLTRAETRGEREWYQIKPSKNDTTCWVIPSSSSSSSLSLSLAPPPLLLSSLCFHPSRWTVAQPNSRLFVSISDSKRCPSHLYTHQVEGKTVQNVQVVASTLPLLSSFSFPNKEPHASPDNTEQQRGKNDKGEAGNSDTAFVEVEEGAFPNEEPEKVSLKDPVFMRTKDGDEVTMGDIQNVASLLQISERMQSMSSTQAKTRVIYETVSVGLLVVTRSLLALSIYISLSLPLSRFLSFFARLRKRKISGPHYVSLLSIRFITLTILTPSTHTL